MWAKYSSNLKIFRSYLKSPEPKMFLALFVVLFSAAAAKRVQGRSAIKLKKISIWRTRYLRLIDKSFAFGNFFFAKFLPLKEGGSKDTSYHILKSALVFAHVKILTEFCFKILIFLIVFCTTPQHPATT